MDGHSAENGPIPDDSAQATGLARKLVLVNIVSADPKRMADFYRDVLGAVIVDDEEHGAPFRTEIWFGERNDNGLCIAVLRDEGFKPRTTDGCAHCGFEFRVADADAEYARIKDLGVEVGHPPKDVPWGYRYFGIKDPDGNAIDLVAAL